MKPVQPPHIPVFFGGSSDDAIPVAGKHADIYALWGETHAQVREPIARVRAAAARTAATSFASACRSGPCSPRRRTGPGPGPTPSWSGPSGAGATGLGEAAPPPNEGSRRLLAAAAQGSVSTSGSTRRRRRHRRQGNSTALVGTPDQVADALLDYYDLGITTFLIRGFDP